jgi:hypothetical protein
MLMAAQLNKAVRGGEVKHERENEGGPQSRGGAWSNDRSG